MCSMLVISIRRYTWFDVADLWRLASQLISEDFSEQWTEIVSAQLQLQFQIGPPMFDPTYADLFRLGVKKACRPEETRETNVASEM